jgi:hypothetical protein
MSAGICELTEHFFGVSFGERDAQSGVSLHLGKALANFAFLSTSQDGRLLDFVPVFIEPAGEGSPFGQRKRQYLGFELFHAHGCYFTALIGFCEQ